MSEFNWKNPWVLGGAGVLLIVLVMASRGGGGGNNNAALGVASQGVATSANVQLAGLSTQLAMEQDQTYGALHIADMQAKTSIFGLALNYLSNVDANMVQLENTRAAVNVNQSNNTTLLRLTSTNNETFQKIAPQLAQIASTQATTIAQISANEAIAIAGMNMQGRQQQNNANLGSQAISAGSNLLGGLFGGGGGGIFGTISPILNFL